MNNYIIISKTYAQTTPESVEQGDFSETGFISEREEVTFRELVDLMREHYQPSRSPCEKLDTQTCLSSGFNTIDYQNGIEEETSIHFHRDNTPNAAKYWNLAYQIAKR